MADASHTPPTQSGVPFTADAAKGLLGSLFDLSFKYFVTPKVIQFVFILMLIAVALWTILIIVAGFGAGVAWGILAIIFSPLIYVIGVLFARIYLELVIVLFRIYETLRDRQV